MGRDADGIHSGTLTRDSSVTSNVLAHYASYFLLHFIFLKNIYLQVERRRDSALLFAGALSRWLK